MTPRRAHYWRPNEAQRYPRRLVCLDSEAATHIDGRLERHRLRCAVATFDRLDPADLSAHGSDELVSLDTGELWSWIDAKTNAKERLVVFAHNLGYDLRLTGGLVELPRLGYELQAFSLDSYRCWARWRRGTRSLVMVDTVSFVGRALAHVAADLGRSRPELPAGDAPLDEWVARCRGDAYALRELVLRLLAWLEREDCGNFRMTGPAQASAAFRHRFLPRRALLVHDDIEALAAERRSAYTGRCEVWRHGKVRGPLHEWDFALAYARIARDAVVPVRLRGSVESPTPAQLARYRRRFRVLADVTVTTDVPVVPTEHDGRMVWPVGTFRSTLWDAELELAEQAGAQVEVGKLWLYQGAPLLGEWARWILERLEGVERETCPVGKAVLKGWSRSLIGRFGLRYPRWQEVGTTADADALLLPYVDGDTGATGTYLRLGRQVLEQSGVEEGGDSAPAVMAYVMALARVRLWRAMQAAGLDHTVYVDTDSVVVDELGSRRLAEWAATPAGEGLRLKHRYAGAHLWAPRAVELGADLRVAGLPKSSKRVGRRRWVAEVWEGPSEAVRRRRPSEVIVRRTVVQSRARDFRRDHLPKGVTAARRVEPSPPEPETPSLAQPLAAAASGGLVTVGA